MCRIFYDTNSMPPRDKEDRPHVTWQTGKMNCDDCLSSRSDRCFNACRIDIEAVLLYIDEYRMGAQVADHLRRRGEREWSRNNFVAGPHSHRLQCQVESRRSRVNSKSFHSFADIARKFRFETARFGSGRQPAGSEGIDNLSDLLAPNIGNVKGNEC